MLSGQHITPATAGANLHHFAPTTVIPGRPRAWLNNPIGISPVSCTNVAVEDSYYEVDGDFNFLDTIAGSRVFLTKVLKGNAGCSINLSKLRPKDTPGSQGLVAQGVTNFLAVYSQINAEVRRGNGFKNGAVNLVLEFNHPDYLDFIQYPQEQIPWAKKVTIIPQGFSPDPKDCKYLALLDAVAAGTTYVVKQQCDSEGQPLEVNVCMAIWMRNRSTCTLSHANLGQVSVPSDIPAIMINAAIDLDWIWEQFAANQPDHFTQASLDKQVGLGFIGLANMLAYFKVSYHQFTQSLEKLIQRPGLMVLDSVSDQLAIELQNGYSAVQEFAEKKGYHKFFTVEPTATCSYRELDLRGYVCTPEISPPTCHPDTKITRRTSDESFEDYQYPIDVEYSGGACGGVSYDTYFRLASCIQILMNRTGLAHGISFNWWLDETVENMSFQRWIKSPLKTIYYRWATSNRNQDKSAFSDEASSEDEAYWGDEDYDDDPAVDCPIRTQENDTAPCLACAG